MQQERPQLYPYQTQGAEFLYKTKRALLADEVGLGKTPQALIAAERVLSDIQSSRPGLRGLAIVLCDASTKLQWAREAERFTSLKPAVVGGTKKQRYAIYNRVDEYDLLIANYELVRQDPALQELMIGTQALLRKFNHRFRRLRDERKKQKILDSLEDLVYDPIPAADLLILDEAQRVKNFKTELFTYARWASQETPCIFLLSATPLENNLDELYTLFRLIDPNILGANPQEFRKEYMIIGRFGQKTGEKRWKWPELHRKVAPYMLRRTRQDVGIELPDVQIFQVPLEPTGLQLEINRMLWDELEEAYLQRHRFPDKPLGVMALMVSAADHPGLLLLSDSRIARRVAQEARIPRNPSSPKLEWVRDHIWARLRDNPRSKVVIFSAFERMVTLLAEACEAAIRDALHIRDAHNKVVRLTGAENQAQRDRSVQAFRQGEALVFLATEAGGRGLNLQVSDTLINVDLPWNPSRVAQRIGRIRRIGSPFKDLTIYNLITEGTIDERIASVHLEKGSLFRHVIDGGRELPEGDTMGFVGRILEEEMKAREAYKQAAGE